MKEEVVLGLLERCEKYMKDSANVVKLEFDSGEEYEETALSRFLGGVVTKIPGLTRVPQKTKNKLFEKGQRIAHALVFWRFVAREMKGVDWEIRRDFLETFATNKDNIFVRVVAMAESLPTSVWRKILWKHNIDFSSFEAFLRRLDDGQIEAISVNYKDLIVSESVPRIFGFWRRLFDKKLTVGNLLTEELNMDVRYQSKGSWVMNLLNLDFGFNQYPKGKNDDYRVMQLSPLIFLSVKNHVDDFIVNKEDGLYWLMYKPAHSNYVWFPNRVVELKKHICPGFWYTLIMHAWFWIVSPVTLAVMSPEFSRHAFEFSLHALALVPFVFVAGLTPLWLLVACLKFVFTRIGRFLDKYGDKNLDMIGISLSLIVSGRFVFQWLWIVFVPAFGVWGFGLAVAVCLLYAGYGAYHHEKHGKNSGFADYPWLVKIPSLLLALTIVVIFLAAYGTVIVSFLAWCATVFAGLIAVVAVSIATFFVLLATVWLPVALAAIWKLCVDLWEAFKILGALWLAMAAIYAVIVAILFALPFLLSKVFDKLDEMSPKKLKIFRLAEKTVGYLIIALFCFCVAIMWYKSGTGAAKLTFTGAVIPMMLFGTVAFVLWYVAQRVNPSTRHYQNLSQIADLDYWFPWKEIRGMCENNPYLCRLDLKKQRDLFCELEKFAWITSGNKKRYALYTIILSSLQTDEQLNTLLANADELRWMPWSLQEKVVALILKGSDIKTALAKIQEAEEKRARKIKEARELVKCFLGATLDFFSVKMRWSWILFWWLILAIGWVLGKLWFVIAKIGQGIWFVLRKIAEYVATVRMLYKLFNERCPFVGETKKLDF